jgi:hypothetical protein
MSAFADGSCRIPPPCLAGQFYRRATECHSEGAPRICLLPAHPRRATEESTVRTAKPVARADLPDTAPVHDDLPHAHGPLRHTTVQSTQVDFV